MPSNTFGKHERIRLRRDFERLFEKPCTVNDDHVTIFGSLNQLEHPRLGCAVSRKVGSAVVRNRFRRVYHEAFRLIKGELPAGVDLLLKPRSNRPPQLRQIQNSLRQLAPQLLAKLRRREKSA